MTTINSNNSDCFTAGKTSPPLNGKSNIPLRRTLSKPSTPTVTKNRPVVNEDAVRWKMKYEEAERKRKELISQNERKIMNYNELERKYNNLQIKIDELETELFEKNESLTKLTTASKNLFKEYDTLKNQYETETGAMHRALTEASHWYKEMKVLKRRTMLLDQDAVDEGVDEDDSKSDSDIDNLNENVKQLSAEIARLQADLNASKLIEFETIEQNINLNQELEEERDKNEKLEAELKSLQENNKQLLRVSEIMRRELDALRNSEETKKEEVEELKKLAANCKAERNVLAHQSAILLHRLNSDDGSNNKLLLMQEIEELKRVIEEERNQHQFEISNLQEKLEESEKNSYNEILEERLKLVESDLQAALERAEKAEMTLKTVPPAPPLPPPPPPPPPLPSLAPPVAPQRTKKLARSSIPDMADALGTVSENGDVATKKAPSVGVNEDIINQIKDGKFTLRKAKKENQKKERETPKAVSEMLNILGSLKRTPKKRLSLILNGNINNNSASE
ncbi:shootin-1 [Agrilus planipennis]|uniref:Shootin-1 n=1 Tax=Agrilus planipennis TaxID=224129 RepID=A0A1W4XIT7_AGRPL|nr:shootin-1 [Agrilus planipennis]XP_018332713.1 shootin-1 [Agrilus planipennis]XP_018332714.1 shootin-1 [Agrilus planipennis]